MMLPLAIGLLLAASVLWRLAALLQRQSGLPRARIRTDDVHLGKRPERPMTAPRYRLTGRPDYLLEHRGMLIPVEAKPLRRTAEPYESDVLQLIAYCLLVEETTGCRPPYGLLRYAEQTWEIPYTAAARTLLLETLAAMDRAWQAADVPRSHEVVGRCVACSQRRACDQRLGE
jgi:CRISPR-associated exonuclease Cas4